MSRVTVQSIADELGLSKFAVSRALSGQPGVSDATRAAVIELAQRLGYSPRARKFSKKVSKNIRVEVIYHDPEVMHRELWIEVQAGVEARAAAAQVAVAVRWTADPRIATDMAASADGFILIGPHADDIIEAIRASATPCVCIGDPLPPLEPMDYIGGADEEGAAAVARHLIQLGHRDFLFVHGRPGYPGRIRRFESFQSQLAGVTNSQVRELVLPEDSAPADFAKALQSLHGEGFVPTGFFCGNDYVAVTVLTELMRLGVRIPDEASVIGYGDYAISRHTSPMLTTVKVPYRQMGSAALSLLMTRVGMGGTINDLPPQRIGLVPQFLQRGTSGPIKELPWPQ
ncbi:MAG: hypothetical protein ABS75_04815 [Pelagibacterium sp. SCN 63-23]|nr:MAG: hypothetical protein ABS75_04815 [Pelagibacterium sp. SCN 63-23]